MFQGGDSVELLAASGKDPAAAWKVVGKVRREYDKLSKAYLFSMEGSALATKMTLPKETAKPLGLTQRYLVVQAWLPAAKAIAVEVGVTDSQGVRRRIVMSSAFRGAVVHQLHAQIPLLVVTRETWLNWCFDIAALVAGSFGQSLNLRTLDSICLSGSCRLRRVFTMKEPPIPTDHPFDFVGGVEIPRAFAISNSTTEYFAAKAAPDAATSSGRGASAGKKAADGKVPPSSSSSSSLRPSSGAKHASGAKTTKPASTSSRPPSSSGVRHIEKVAPPKDTPRGRATPVATVSSTSVGQHSKHIQDRLRIQPVVPTNAPASTSIFQFAVQESPRPKQTQRRPLDSRFQSWEDDDTMPSTRQEEVTTVRPNASAGQASPLRPATEPSTRMGADAADDDKRALPSRSSPKTHHSTAELLALELSLELSKSPFFQVPSPVLASNVRVAGAKSKFLSWEDDDEPAACVREAVGDDEAIQNTMEAPRLDNQSNLDAETNESNQTLKQKPSLFTGESTNVKANSTNENNKSDGAGPTMAPEDIRDCAIDALDPEDTRDDDKSDDDNDELSFDMTNDLQEKSFDFTDALEESLPSMVQMHEAQSPLKQATPPRRAIAASPRPLALRESLDMHPRMKSLLESTDWTQQQPMVDLVYDPILHCYHDPTSNKYYQLK
ncbi:Aste57867_14865 [Aphanomyces stellatus]|uniref:Aste57867_14865 protein n=1 Tax=Aphanomyces stellatus TaxID=120398 RepID=A0A485L1T1_9STRA|nr:hypothetical protein As57867_014809 [Aphanomyces stellatus]VFT91682.1 Aste57867_14865 [Aphanomyces stellatus]